MWRFERTVDGVDGSRDELLPYVGPAAALPLYGALARLPFGFAVRVWTGVLLGALAGLVIASLAPAGARGAVPVLGALLLAFASGPGISDLALGQVALVSAAGIACALLAYERRGVFAGAFATLLAGLQPNLAPALLARLRDRSALAAAALGALAFAALTLAAGGGPGGLVKYLHRLAQHGGAERFDTIQHTPAAIAYAFGAPEALASAAGIACALGALTAVIALTLRARLSPREGTLLALAALPFAVPFFHEHDFVVELIPLTALAVVTRGAARVWTGIATALVGVDWLDLAQRPAGATQIVALALAISCAFVVLGRGARATRADLAPFAAALALACVAIPLARAFPAPVWPDALPRGFRALTSADASAVWAAEQHAAGLDARQPVWGLLRAFPLTGCIVLGIVIVSAGYGNPRRLARRAKQVRPTFAP